MSENHNKYRNPVPFEDGKRHTNPDPFVLRWCGTYYCYATDEFGVKVSESQDLVHWKYIGYAIREKEFHHYWAPSVMYKNGVFYMYYSNIPAEEPDCHQQQMKLATAVRPEGPFVWKKTFFDKFSIDTHPVQWNGELYMLYSVNDWYGTEDHVAGTCILLDKMKTPEELEGNPRPVIIPGLKQEIYAADRFGDGRDWYTIEGACHVVHGKKCWMLYSANAYENVDYFIGTAVADNKADFLEMEWKKYPNDFTWVPLLRKNDMVEGTGHNTVTKAPNLVDDWIVYHGRNAQEELKFGTEQRVMRIDPLYYDGDHMFSTGPSWQETDAPEGPETAVRGEMVEDRLFLADIDDYGIMEFWISAEKNHTGVRYGIYLEYTDEGNYLELQYYSGRNKYLVYRMREGVGCLVSEKTLPRDYDYTAAHCVKIEKTYQRYVIYLDEGELFTFTEPRVYENGRTGLISYFSRVVLHSFVYTKHVMLEGNELQHISRFYKAGGAEISQDGILRFHEPVAVLCRKERDDCYTEEFLMEALPGGGILRLLKDQKVIKEIKAGTAQFSIRHKVNRTEETFFLGGGRYSWPADSKNSVQLDLSGVGILHYCYTKN